MRRVHRRQCLAAAWMCLTALATVGGAQAPVFRSTADAVTVDVSVRRGNRPVTGLTVGDFVLTDNGVAQEIASLSYEALPIDVTVLLDVSGSVSGDTMDMLRRSIADLRKDLRRDDRLRLVAFNMQVRRVLDVDAPASALDAAFGALATGGSSAVFDAVAVALAFPGAANRRQFIALLTDGQDNASITTAAEVLDVARRTTPTVSVLLASPLRQQPTGVFADLAAATGGIATTVMPSDRLGDGFRRVLERFRSSYVLTFSPKGVRREGRHALDVRVARGGLDVRARREYIVR